MRTTHILGCDCKEPCCLRYVFIFFYLVVPQSMFLNNPVPQKALVDFLCKAGATSNIFRLQVVSGDWKGMMILFRIKGRVTRREQSCT